MRQTWFVFALLLSVTHVAVATGDCEWYPYDAASWATCVAGAANLCESGLAQSPINLPPCAVADASPLISLSWGGNQSVDLSNNGHAVTIKPTVTGYMITSGATYTLDQCDFHYGSEHTVGGVQYELGAHCVHSKIGASDSYTHSVVGRFFTVGAIEDAFLALFQDSLPQQPVNGAASTVSSFTGPVDMIGLVSGADLSNYWSYLGSFTTPGCAEVVEWRVLMDVATISAQQLQLFQTAIGSFGGSGNFRPPQPLNGRVVTGCASCDLYPFDETAWTSCTENAAPLCSTGEAQSPIDLPPCSFPTPQTAITVNWGGMQQVRMVNDGQKIMISPTSATGVAGLFGAQYQLRSCHFHLGAKHTVGGLEYELPMHCVHDKVSPVGGNTLGVIGRFFTVGAANSFIAQIQDSLPATPAAGGETMSPFTGPLDLEGSLEGADMTRYWSYAGSLTTPPCTETIDWAFLMAVAEVSQAQLDLFSAALGDMTGGGYFRPPQPLNGRQVTGCGSCELYPYDSTRWATCVSNAADVCASGYSQSPVDFLPCPSPADREPISLSWGGSMQVRIVNDGHAVIMTPMARGSTMLAGTEYSLLRCEFHYGSEHTVGGQQHDMAVHCIHEKPGAQDHITHGVLGRFFSTARSQSNPFLAQFQSRLPQQPQGSQAETVSSFSGNLNLEALFAGADMSRFWTYSGSMTTPPCSEVVEWAFLMDVADMSQTQLGLFQTAIGSWSGSGNFRPPQPLFGREVEGCLTCYWYPYNASDWATCVSEASPVCQTGMAQSPIDLPSCSDSVAMPYINTAWGGQHEVFVINNEHGLVMMPNAMALTIVDGDTSHLLGCSFHHSSEHTVGGAQLDMEVQCVHERRSPDGQWTHAIVSRFFEVGTQPNAFLSEIEDKLPPRCGDCGVHLGPSVDLEGVVAHADMSKYWFYEGSFTTPGCQEAAHWMILMDVATMSQAQFDAVKTAVGYWEGHGNFRPPQPLNGRQVKGCATCATYPFHSDSWATCVESASEVCRSGHAQSPIDLPSCRETAELEVISLGWTDHLHMAFESGPHYLKLLPQSEQHTIVGSEAFNLMHCEFHLGSEHTVGGKQYDVSVQCLHSRMRAGSKLERNHMILARFFDTGVSSNPLLAHVAYIVPDSGAESVEVDTTGELALLFDGAAMMKYWAYSGSLTTPGCDEGVEWKVLMDSGSINLQDLQALQRAIGADAEGHGNFRPPQPLHGRDIAGCAACDWYPYSGTAWATCVSGADAICEMGRSQSPIDLPECHSVAESTNLTVAWGGTQEVTLVNTGHTLEMRPSVAGSMEVDGMRYTLLQCHLHHGSEHTVGGHQYDMGVHCVHEKVNPTDKYTHAVIGRFFEVSTAIGAVNNFFSIIEDDLPRRPEDHGRRLTTEVVNLEGLLHGANLMHYWSYLGSLTTPGCAEVVEWKVLMDVGTLSAQQLLLFQESIGSWGGSGNFRPPQPLYDRVVGGCQPCDWYPYDGDNWATCTAGADETCRSGEMQSPIDLPECAVREQQPPISIQWGGSQQVKLANNGHSVVITPSKTGSMFISGQEYILAQCHFHYASEHTVSEHVYDMSVHCVHEKVNPTDQYTHAVLGRFLHPIAGASSFLGAFDNHLPSNPHMQDSGNEHSPSENLESVSQFVGPIDLEELLAGADMSAYWAYLGSLTTPGCNEVVEWKFLMDIATLSINQLLLFQAAIGSWQGVGNFRPPQPLNGRVVTGCVSCEWYPYSEAKWSNCVAGASAVCSAGHQQSPIDFPACDEVESLPSIGISWGGTQYIAIINNGHSVVLEPSLTGYMMIEREMHTLAQCHFHYGSEHTVGGYQYDLGVHCVHAKAMPVNGFTHAVLGRFFTASAEANPFLAHILPQIPERSASTGHRRLEAALVNMEDMLDGADMAKYWAYDGSLTTPGCDEIVEWKFLMDAGSLSRSQLSVIQEAIGSWHGSGNFRPPQPLHGREVRGCQMCEWYPYDEHKWSTCVSGAAAVCELGLAQSPIDLPHCTSPADSEELGVSWGGEQAVELSNDGHTVTFTPSVEGFTMSLGITYSLQQCQLHYGSEHTVGQHQYDLSVHCVHSKVNARDEYTHGVLGRFFEVGEGENTFFSQFASELPARPGDSYRRLAEAAGSSNTHSSRHTAADVEPTVSSFSGALNMEGFIEGANRRHYWTYKGSLTTPGCDEVVDWIFLMGVGTISEHQLQLVKTAIGSWGSGSGNFRPPQPLNGRLVTGCQTCDWYPYHGSSWATCAEDAADVCLHGNEQSPVDLPACDTPTVAPALSYDYFIQEIVLSNTGNTVQLKPLQSNYVVVEGHTYYLQHCHMHHGSEHTVGGHQFAMSVHCIHRIQNGHEQYILARFYDLGSSSDPFLAQFEDHLPESPRSSSRRLATSGGSVSSSGGHDDHHTDSTLSNTTIEAHEIVSDFVGPIDMALLLAGVDTTRYWDYFGSLTIPPCTEGVEWKLLMDVGSISRNQLSQYQTAIGTWDGVGNFRTPQPLNGRTIFGCETCDWYPFVAHDWATCARLASDVCEYGLSQSPIDLPLCTVQGNSQPISLDYGGSQAIQLLNDGHGIKIKPSITGRMIVAGTSYTLQQCQLHYGSEHTIGGHQYDLEVHCVHTHDHPLDQYTHSVLGRVYTTTTGEENVFFADFVNYLPINPNEDSRRRLSDDEEGEGGSRRLLQFETVSPYVGPANLEDLMHGADMSKYWSYFGSLTSPGCEEVVAWKVIMDVGSLSEFQLQLFQSAIGSWRDQGNFRPPQPLNGRIVAGCGECEWYPYYESAWVSCVQDASEVCGDGAEQSPIDLPLCTVPSAMPYMNVSWGGPQQVTILNSGHGVEIQPSVNGILKLEGADFILLHCAFHYGSEHTIGDVQYDMEMHCVHENFHVVGNAYVLIARMFSVSNTANPLLTAIQDHLPARAAEGTGRRLFVGQTVSDFAGVVDMADLLVGANLSKYWAYHGGFTIPSCDEVVDWKFLMDVGHMTAEQFNLMKQAIGEWEGIGNFRPPQPLNGRTVLGCASCDRYPYDASRWATCVEGAQSICQSGHFQSPVDFDTCVTPENREAISKSWGGPQEVTLENTGNMIRLHPSASATTNVGTMRLVLKDCEFHYEAEHTVGGHHHDMEMHCVHLKETPTTQFTHVIIGRFLDEYAGEPDNEDLLPIVSNLPQALAGEATTSMTNFDPVLLLKGANLLHYWTYQGSFTSPGCDEVVDWMFLMESVHLSHSQLLAFQQAIGSWEGSGNFRPPQPLHGRSVAGCSCEWYPYNVDAWATCVPRASETCRSGTYQSPVDLPECVPISLPSIATNWGGTQLIDMTYTGTTLSLQPGVEGNTSIAGKLYDLQSCHWHHGAEHTVGGLQHSMEIQCVHNTVNPTDQFTKLYLTRLVTQGDSASGFISQVESHTRRWNIGANGQRTSGTREASTPLNLELLLDGADRTHYWHYFGSSTVPSCEETVEWVVMMDPMIVTPSQLADLQEVIGFWGESHTGNFRPPVPLNGRIITGCLQCNWYPYDSLAWATCVTGHTTTCQRGRSQSPIDFEQCSNRDVQEPIVLNWGGPQQVKLSNNGHGLVVAPQSLATMTIGGFSYTLQQCHLHHTSEHTVGGHAAAMGVHCVHAKVGATDQYTHSVLGRFIEVSQNGSLSNAFMAQIVDHLPPQPVVVQEDDRRLASGDGIEEVSDFTGPLDFAGLVADADLTYYWAYLGSLTTPGCDEIVEWKFLMDVAMITQQQLETFQQAIGFWHNQGNFRPPQPLFGRAVTGCCEWYPYERSAWGSCVVDASEVCSTGVEQSPVDFDRCDDPSIMPGISMQWGGVGSVQVTNDGHTIKLVPGVVANTSINGVELRLQHCEFHHGSEHTVHLEQFDLSVHCVHSKVVVETGDRTHVVVGRFFNEGDEASTFFTRLGTNYPTRPSSGENSLTRNALDLTLLFEGADLSHYWAYSGSLTTPPCSEVVEWKVLMDVGELTSAQLTAVKNAIGTWASSGNFRPPQQLNGRVVEGCGGSAANAAHSRAPPLLLVCLLLLCSIVSMR